MPSLVCIFIQGYVFQLIGKILLYISLLILFNFFSPSAIPLCMTADQSQLFTKRESLAIQWYPHQTVNSYVTTSVNHTDFRHLTQFHDQAIFILFLFFCCNLIHTDIPTRNNLQYSKNYYRLHTSKIFY